MAAEFTFIQSGESVDEPYDIISTTTYTFTITNTGDVSGTELGFYLRSASNNGPFEFPSSNSPAINLVDILREGNEGYGLKIIQGVSETVFTSNQGDSLSTKIPLTIGSGDIGDQLAVGESIEISIELTFSPSVTAKTFYVDLVLA